MNRRRSATLAVLPALGLLISASAAEGQIYTRRSANGVVEATNIPDAADYRLIYPGKGTLIHSRGFRRMYNGEFNHHIEDAARHHLVSADLVRAVIQVESEFDVLAVSSKGAQGLMQLMPFTARRFGVADAFDPRQNIFGGVQYLRLLSTCSRRRSPRPRRLQRRGERRARYRGIPPTARPGTTCRRSRTSWGEATGAPVGRPPAPGRGRAGAARPSPAAGPAHPSPHLLQVDRRQGHPPRGPDPAGRRVTYTMIRALD